MQSDHDLLITLVATTQEGFRSLHESVAEIKENMKAKASQEFVVTLEKRISVIETDAKSDRKKIYLITGGVAVAQFVIVLAVNFLKH